MGSRTHNHPRCSRCYMHEELCICAEVRPLQTRARLALVLHHNEIEKTTNTGRFALQTLTNSEAYIRGLQEGPADLSPLQSSERRLLVLFPSEEARELSPELIAEDPRPITLAVPDGTWAQARRAVRREPILAEAQHVITPPGPPSRYKLRKEHEDHGLATIEAIARAFGIIEGPEAQEALERIFDIQVERTMLTRNPPPTRERDPNEPSWKRRGGRGKNKRPEAKTSSELSSEELLEQLRPLGSSDDER